MILNSHFVLHNRFTNALSNGEFGLSHFLLEMHVELVNSMLLCKCSFTYYYKHVLHAQLMELINHLRQISKPLWIKSEASSLVCIIKVIPLHILNI